MSLKTFGKPERRLGRSGNSSVADMMPSVQHSQEIIREDMQHICNQARDELLALSGKKLLITGGAGFLGYYLTQTVVHWNKRLNRDQKIQLTIYDNFHRGIPTWLEPLTKNNSLKLVKHDITKQLPKNVEDFKYVIHAASIASPTYYRKYPIKTMDANVNGLRILLDYCRKLSQRNGGVQG